MLPIVAYGHPTLRKKSVKIDPDYPDLDKIIEGMFQTMYSSQGVGLAAPQINLSIRLVIMDASHYASEDQKTENLKKVFINPVIIKEEGEEWTFNEGCLSIPEIREDIIRKQKVHVQYYDEHFNFHDEVQEGVIARILQHEYDHLEGILFVDHVSPLRKMMLKRKLHDISKGNIEVNYKMIFPAKKKKIA